MRTVPDADRRDFLAATAKLGVGLAMASGAAGSALARDPAQRPTKAKKVKPEEVGPTEDLMREHGVLNRVLLIYDHFIVQLDRKRDLNPEFVKSAASIIRSFVEDYHLNYAHSNRAGSLRTRCDVVRARVSP